MRRLLCSLLLCLPWAAFHTDARADPRKDWDDFRAGLTEQAAGPTGMYAIQDVAVIAPGEAAYLPAAARAADLRWARQRGDSGAVTLSYRDGKAVLEGKGVVAIDLMQAKDHQQTLPNGLTVRITPYEDSLKAWLYNPALTAQRFKGLSFFPYDPKGVVTGRFTRKDAPVAVSHLDSRNHTGVMYWIGEVALPIQGKTYTLRAFNKQKDWKRIDHVLLFFTDKTSKKTSYGGGRSLETHFPAGAAPSSMTFNLNTMYSFLCAHSQYYNCPINLTTFVPVELKYGEKYPPSGK